MGGQQGKQVVAAHPAGVFAQPVGEQKVQLAGTQPG